MDEVEAGPALAVPGLAEDDVGARVGLVDAGEDLHQRRLARSVLSDERDDLPRPTSRETSSSAFRPGKLFESPRT